MDKNHPVAWNSEKMINPKRVILWPFVSSHVSFSRVSDWGRDEVLCFCNLFFLLVRLLVFHSLSNHMDEWSQHRKTVTKGRFLKPVICIRVLKAVVERWGWGGGGGGGADCLEFLGRVFVNSCAWGIRLRAFNNGVRIADLESSTTQASVLSLGINDGTN